MFLLKSYYSRHFGSNICQEITTGPFVCISSHYISLIVLSCCETPLNNYLPIKEVEKELVEPLNLDLQALTLMT